MSDFKKGMILAAGLGTRLLPITEKMPKPLVPVLNIPNVLFGLDVLKRAGIEEVILNLHHLPELLEKYLGTGKQLGMKISYSREKQLLGTGGGLKNAEGFFGKDAFALVNCDFISNVELAPHLAAHKSRGAWATMILHEDEALQPFYAKVGCTAQGKLTSLPRCEVSPPERAGIFTGIHLLSPEVFSFLEAVPSGINEVLYPRLMKEFPEKALALFTKDNYWFDTGERSPFWRSCLALCDRLAAGDPILKNLLTGWLNYQEVTRGVWCPKGDMVPSNIEIQGTVIFGKNVQVARGSVIGPYAILGDDTHIEEKTHFTKAIAMPGSLIKTERVSDCLWHAGLTLPISLRLP